MEKQQKKRLVVISTDTATRLLLSLCPKKKLAPVNVQGKVLAVSEVTQVKGSSLLLIKLYSGVNIVIKNKEKLKWQPLLIPHQEYVISGLRLTTLEKGSSHQCRVYTVTEKSHLFSHDVVHTNLMPVSQLLEQMGLSEADIGLAPTIEPQIPDHLFSYKGTITDVLDRALGVFELDKQARLFLGQVPTAEKVALLQIGDIITVHNVHYRQTKQIPKLILYSCILGNITVEQQPSRASSSLSSDTECKKIPSLPVILQKYLYLYGLSRQKLDFLYILRKTLNDQFLDLFGKKNLEKLMGTILSLPLLSWKQCIDGPYRNLLDEFIHTPHTCSLQTEQTEDQNLPLFKTVKDVRSQDLPRPDNTTGQWNSTTHVVDEQILLGILKTCENSGQSMIYDTTGSVPIVTCCCRGKQAKCDHSTDTNCSHKCNCKGFSIGKVLPCTRIHTCCREKVVALRNFVIITETRDYVLSKTNKYKQYLCADFKHTVMLGDLSNFDKEVKTSLGRKAHTDRGEPIPENVNVVRNKNIENHGKTDDVEIIDIEKLEHKDSVGTELVQAASENKARSSIKEIKTYLHRHLLENGSSRFCRKAECMPHITKSADDGVPIVEGNSSVYTKPKTNERLSKTLAEISNSNIDNEHENGTIYSVKPINKKRSINYSVIEEAEHLKKVKQNVAKDDNDQINHCEEQLTPPMTENKTDNDRIGEASAANCVDIFVVSKEALRPDGQSVNEDTLMFCAECRILKGDSSTETIIAMFNGSAIRWYPYLYNGHTYRLTCAEGDLPFNTPKMPCKKVQRALLKSKAKSWKIVNDGVEIEERYGERNLELTWSSISTVLSLSYRGSFVNICGIVTKRVIVGRDQQAPKTTNTNVVEPSGSSSINTRLDVQEIGCRDILQVYMDHRSYCVPLGLIPGAAVRFTNLERKVSRSSNVYCRYVALSSVEIVCISSDNLTNQNQPFESCDIDKNVQLPRMHLVDRWQHHDRKSVFQCVCDVSQISKLSLKCLCEYCGAMIVRSKCSNTSCFGGEEAKMLARASVLVDDGTTVAMVTMTGSSVQDLLQLSHDQWACLEAETKTSGEIFVQQTKQMCETPLEQFVNMLCDNRQVKQPWLMTLRHKYTGKDTLDHIKIDEFAQKMFDTGSGRITTHCLPFLQLECVAMETFDPTSCATYYLANPTL